MQRFAFKISLAVWITATMFYVLGVLVGIFYAIPLSEVPLIGFAVLLLELVVAWSAIGLLWLLHLPAPILTMFGILGNENPVHLDTFLGTDGYILLFFGIIGVALALIALRKMYDEPAWSAVFIGLSLFAYALSVVDAITGVCTYIDWNFGGGTHAYCSFGVAAAWPNFLSSTILLVTAIIIYRTTHTVKSLTSTALATYHFGSIR